MRGAATPQISRQQRFKLRRDESHLRRQVHALLAYVLKVSRARLIEKHDRLAVHHSVLRPAERKHIDANVGCDLFEALIEEDRSIRESSTIDVQQQTVVVSEVSQRLQFVARVDRAHLSCLRDRDDARLHVMLNTDAVQQWLDLLRAQFAVRRRNTY